MNNFKSYIINKYKTNVTDLSNYPSDDNISPDQLKAIFDGRTNEEVKKSINGIIGALLAPSAAKQIGAKGGTVEEVLDSKVDKEEGMGLSQTSYTYEEKEKLSRVEDGAQVNSVFSVAGKTGYVSIDKADVGLGNVNNTNDADKPVSNATKEELDKKATKINPEFEGAINIDGALIYKSNSNDGEIIIYRPASSNGAPESTMRIGFDFININGHMVYHSGNLTDLTISGNTLDELSTKIFMHNTGLDVVVGDIETALDEIIEIQNNLIGGDA